MREKHEGNSGGNFEGNNGIRELRPFIESQLVGERRKKVGFLIMTELLSLFLRSENNCFE